MGRRSFASIYESPPVSYLLLLLLRFSFFGRARNDYDNDDDDDDVKLLKPGGTVVSEESRNPAAMGLSEQNSELTQNMRWAKKIERKG